MSRFDEHLARLADEVRALPNGDSIARGLMRLAGEVDNHIAEQMKRPYRDGMAVFEKWNAFMIESLDDTRRYHEEQKILERRRWARTIAADPRWRGGYADALALLESEKKAE